MDVETEITLLRLNIDDTIHTFYKRVQDFRTKLIYSRDSVDKMRLIKFYQKVMTTSRNHFPVTRGFISDLNIHINKYGSNTTHPTHTRTSIYEYLICIEAPAKLNVGFHCNYRIKIKISIKSNNNMNQKMASIHHVVLRAYCVTRSMPCNGKIYVMMGIRSTKNQHFFETLHYSRMS